MSEEITKTETAPLGRIRFPSGRVAYGSDERVKAVQERERYNEAKQKAILRDHNLKINPAGLCQIKSSSGEVERKSGSPAMIG